MSKVITIGKTKVGGSHPCFIIAEVGINFDGKYDQALALIDAAADAGCNAVKFQMFKAERMYAKKAGKYKTASKGLQDIIEIVKEGELPPAWVPKLQTYAKKRGIEWFSSVCDEQSSDILTKNRISAYKMTSYELTHLPLFKHMAKEGKPVIISSGGGSLKEVAEAVEVVREAGCDDILLNHCNGVYPPKKNDLNLGIIKTFQLAFPDVVIGYSDNGSDPKLRAAHYAVALGVKAYEVHITLDRSLPGPDHSFALEPKELKALVDDIRQTEKEIKAGKEIRVDEASFGSTERKGYPAESYVRKFCYRSVFTKKSIKKGERLTKQNIAVLRRGIHKAGLEPKYYDVVMGHRASRNIKENVALQWNDVLQS